MKKKWQVYLINHSHTDIGYTERQEKIARYHYDFIRQAIDAVGYSHTHPECSGYKWQCENFWQVQQFMKYATDEYKKKFTAYVRSGEIGLSGNYLNMTDLVLESAFDNVLNKMNEFSEQVGKKAVAGMCADINGLAWGYPDVLYRHGVKNFYTALHPHHGMFPLYKKVQPYYWETPLGNKILMWNGDHYHVGNEMFFCPHGGADYTFHDEYSPLIQQNLILNKNAAAVDEQELEICITRISRYLNNLESEGYPYSIVPFMVSGAITDNAPPNVQIARRVHDPNMYFQGQVTFQMATLEDFFGAVEETCQNIPIYKGDFTDWWADGVGSTPAAVKVYLDAARKFELCRKLDPDCKILSQNKIDEAAKNLMLYAEHTWGYSSSVSEPWDSMVESLESKKTAYAVNANTEISTQMDDLLASLGEVSIRQDKPQHFKVINPHDHRLHTNCFLYIEFWEYVDGLRYNKDMPIVVTNSKTGETYPCQVKQIARATQVEIELTIEAKQTLDLEIHLQKKQDFRQFTIQNHAHIGAEGVEDLLHFPRVDEGKIETKAMTLTFDDRGVKSICWNEDGQELIRQGSAAPLFSGIYEVTPIKPDPCSARRQMGRNRKSYGTKRYYSELTDRKVVEDGTVYSCIELNYQFEGTKLYSVMLKAYKSLPKLEISVRIHKTSCWEPENLYIALPLTAGEDSELYVNKMGCVFRPGIDQLPGTCQDFYLVQNSIAWKSGKRIVSLVTKDAPLIALGSLTAKPIQLCDGKDKERNRSMVYSWPMNNFWETNFKVDLAGFYEFRYLLQVYENESIETVFKLAKDENEGIITGYAN